MTHQGTREKGKPALALVVAIAVLMTACGGSSGRIGDSKPVADQPAEPPPDFGPNVTIFTPAMAVADINAKLQGVAAQSTGFDGKRHAIYFMPGTYGSAAGQSDPATATGHVDSPVGVNMTVQGLGAAPTDVTINGNLRAGVAGQPALSTFWRSLANMTINPIQADEPAHTMRWNTSQASPLRRLNVAGNLDLAGGIAFGNFIANSRVAGEVRSAFSWEEDRKPAVTGGVEGGQAQYYTRDSEIGSWQGRSANIVMSGVVGAPATQFAPGDKTSLASTPLSREAPHLYHDGKNYRVFVPSPRTDARGVSWGMTARDGTSLPMSTFHIAKPGDSAATLNGALAQGRNLLLTPGVYTIDRPIRVTRANAVVMGMGLATLTPTDGTAAVLVDDVPGVILSSFMVDANTKRSDVLVQVGPRGASKGKSSDPTTLHDIFIRIGGSYAGMATTSLEINQNDVLVDHAWLWRADHGNPDTVGWDINLADHGMIVNGANVTALALFAEHYQKTQVLWNANGGRTIFMECEPPYDPPSQARWMNSMGNTAENGYPCYEVAGDVTSHEATGLISWTFFRAPPPTVIYARSAIKAPVAPGVRFTNTSAGKVFGSGGFEHVFNDIGGPVDASGPASFVVGLAALRQVPVFPTAP
ncbi:adenylyl cyclase [Pseudoduganella umbonata]|uniref:Adenylyl cyclase n=1 Tax=Pseudoduganella umbonata TaxID=864828 RepID=A0A4P8HHV9_9BURK|nr:adenylyl cyclase [Pseudoduganella umbonata]MBB3224906.1 hypothetical protein [Pseudoduganella umbonata]QCP09189.1 adenylyl cyclase [Pseudoduganella umbonata]